MNAPPCFGYSVIVNRQVIPVPDLGKAASHMADAYRRSADFRCMANWKPRSYRELHDWERHRLIERAIDVLV